MRNTQLNKKNKLNNLIVQELWKKGKTQKDLAEELGISVSSISALINGYYKPSVKRLHAISQALDLDIEILVKAMFEE